VYAAKQFKYADSEHRKPPVPRPSDRPVMGLRTTKDYVTQNAVENIASVARRPDRTYVDTRRGDKHSLIPSGLEPVYVHKKVSSAQHATCSSSSSDAAVAANSALVTSPPQLSAAGVRGIAMTVSVCLSLCSRISKTTRPNFTEIFCIYILSVSAQARSSSDDIAVRYVLPVMWMTSYLPIMGYMSRG